ncbi:UvrD-helicase domain-containing protein [Natrarchaeobius oligotrophus]|uniref:DNA 3'-5' helicase n=1 Tax=Natrarchaeobius chitinivorans TaxID=1679083 RepID=A0A3N6NSZ5_NATCH|nr:UvrD-helicase domain-containing protein [Natrarchaeobius chitinivorans]RQH03453.1 PD-(D/E)XK nuclease family protein [Natrarchaeobius chitinivorans]
MGEIDRKRLEPRGNQRAVIESRAACTSVDAGAGTGKTTTMLLRIERAIDRGEVDPDDVLVLTFANEAAGSIRDAVSRRLDPDTAAAIDVYTYHSFCYRLVREYAYHLGYSPEFEVVTERRRRRIVGRLLADNEYDFAAASATGDGSTADLVDSIDRFIRAMSQEGIRPETLRAELPGVRTLELLSEFVLWLERRADEELSFDNEALRYFSDDDHLESARESLVEYGTLITYCREKIAEAPAEFREDAVVRDVDRYLRVLQECVTNTIEALSLEEPATKQLPRALFGNEIWRTATDRIEQSPFGRLKHYVEFLRIARHYAEVYADYHARLEGDRTLDFDELVRTATRLLADGSSQDADATDESGGGTARRSVAEEITGRWEQVYCDEFQDTDETQFALITALTDGPDRPDLLAIGDKDQAIYGWRGTDREGLDRLAAVYDDHESIELELNFRSRQEILDLTNHCDYGPQSSKTLREVDRNRGESEAGAGAIETGKPEDGSVVGRDGDGRGTSGDESDDRRREANADESEDERSPDRVVKVESDEIERSTAEQVSTTVSRLLNGECENVPRRSLGDVAVIVRTNRQAQAIADELRDEQIPYEISGSPRGEISPGVRTVLSYLRVLVDPDADAHLRRVLLYRYRLPGDDLETLQRADGSLYDATFDAERSTLAKPDRLERAREDLAALERLRDVYPLSGFVRRFRERTRIGWFLTDDERAELDRLERVVEATDTDAAFRALSDGVVDALERTMRGSERERTRGTRSDDCVDVMTVHQAKGLEFDTVLVAYLSDEEWCVETDYAERARYRLLAATLSDDVDSPLLADLAAETVGEEWRVLHVALTRAENHLFVFGAEYDYDGDDDELGVSTASTCLADEIEWSVAGERMNLWSALTDSFERVRERYPETVADRTDEIALSADARPGTITYDYDAETSLEPRDAIETVHRLGRLLRNGTLLPAADAAPLLEPDDVDGERIRPVPSGRRPSALTTDATRFPVDALSSATDVPVAMRHSYSAVETYAACPRKHYLDHVVRAIDDPAGGDSRGWTTDGSIPGADRRTDGSQRVVGTVFHDVAEEAFYRGYRTREEWRAAAVRQLTARGLESYREDVLACVDRFFDATSSGGDPVANWEPLAAELPFSLSDVDGVGGEVVGYVDSVRRRPAGGGLVVLDYKATAERIEPADAVQLALYARACERLIEEPIAAAGYVYVGEGAGPGVDLFDPDELPSWSAVRESLEGVDDPGYAETTPGEHCRYCSHRSLGCAPEEYAPAARADDD